jgi:hypothetical protein
VSIDRIENTVKQHTKVSGACPGHRDTMLSSRYLRSCVATQPKQYEVIKEREFKRKGNAETTRDSFLLVAIHNISPFNDN